MYQQGKEVASQMMLPLIQPRILYQTTRNSRYRLVLG